MTDKSTQTTATLPQTPTLFRYMACVLYESLLILALTLFAAAIFYSVFGNATLPPKKYLLQLYLWCVMGAYFVYHWRKGATLAMTTWKLRVMARHSPEAPTQTMTTQQAIIRYCVGSLLIGVSCLWALFDREGLFLHDRLAGTRIVRI